MSRAAASTTAVWSRRDAPQQGDSGDGRGRKTWGKADVVDPAAPAPHLPHPHGDLDTASAETLIAAACSVLPRSAIQLEKRGRSIRRMVEHLSTFPGATWQERWDASGWESTATPLASLNPPRRRAGL